MINELIIHLGDTKTGSTSIQNALAHNAYKTPGKSILYPTKSNHIGLAKTLSQKRHFGERAIRFSRVYTAFQESNADYGIVSAEHFQFVDPQALYSAIDTYWPDLSNRVRLVAYVRPHAGKYLSAFSERVKLGENPNSLEGLFDTLSKNSGLDYTPRFEKWREIFGNRFELRPFIRERMYQGDVVHDFFKYVLDSENFEIEGTISSNPSLTLSQLSLLREVHRRVDKKLPSRKRPRFKDAAGALGRIVAEHMQANGLGQDSEKPRMPTLIAERFVERFSADAEALDAAFFEGFPMSDVLGKCHQNTTDTAQTLDGSDYFSPDVINSVQIFADVLADLLMENPNQFQQSVGSIRMAAGIGR